MGMEMLSQLDLKGKTALVCGASQGIGEATAIALAELGAQVILLARSEDKLKAAQKKLKGSGHKVLALDLSKDDIDGALKPFLPIHIVINNAGGPQAGEIQSALEEQFVLGFKAHVLAAQKIAKCVLPGMKAEKFGRFINIISTSVKAPIPGLGVSNTIRGAMASWAKTLAYEVGMFGITVNNVLPGYTKTERLQALLKNAAEKSNQSTDQVSEQWKATIPARRFAESFEVANAIVFLASPAGSYINGINLPVDGGRTPSL
jgi:3-oxoacyl-[acyl-carrier protein] reductase